MKQTLEAVARQDFPDEYEVIVVDNASTDLTSEIARSIPGVTVLREERKGTQWARECGRKKARGEIIAFLDADSIPPPDWLKKGVAYFSRPDIVGVSGPCNYHDLQQPGRSIWFLFQKVFYRFGHFLFQHVLGVTGVLAGANHFIRSSALEAIGGLDTSFVFYGDDADTAKRLTREGTLLFRNDLVVDTSARRVKAMGVRRLFVLYTVNFFRSTITGKAFTRE